MHRMNAPTEPKADCEPVPVLAPVGAVPVAAGSIAADSMEAAPGPVAPAAARDSLVARGLRVLRREPVLFVTLGYLFVSFIGLWANYWFYGRFGIPVLEYMQASDFLVAGVRQPGYALVLAGAVLLARLITWPERYRQARPDRVAALRQRRWGRLLFHNPAGRFFRMAPETGLVFGSFWILIWALFAYVQGQADDVGRGGGHGVRVTLAGARAPMAGDTRLLGTTAGFVFLYWPSDRRAEAVPVESIARIETLRDAWIPPAAVAPPAAIVPPAGIAPAGPASR